MVPVWVTLPKDVPARERFEILFEWTSQGDTSVADTARITIEARQTTGGISVSSKDT